MAYTNGIELPDLLELSSGNYVADGLKSYTPGIECPDLLTISSGNCVSDGSKSYTFGVECPDLLELTSANYISFGTKSFVKGLDLYISIKPVFPGDDSIEIVLGIYMDFVAAPRYGRSPLKVRFNNLSSEFLTNWFWDFGDGEYSIDYNPVHTYRYPGYYDVSLRAKLYPDIFSIIKRN